MKKLLAVLLVALLAIGIVGCSEKPATTDPTATDKPEGEKTIKVALLLPYIGDQSYFDIVYSGFQEISALPNVEAKLIEMGKDNSKWENYYLEAAEGGYDLIIGGNWEAEPSLYKIAKEFPDQKFINFDYSAPEDLPNVYAMTYKSEELGFLAGVVAATASKTGKIGAIGGMDSPSINDFFGGYITGAQAVNPDIKMSFGYVGNFQDAPKAKEQADNMYKSGVDVIFHAAGGAGNGLFESASGIEGVWAIGVDSDQSLTFSEKPEIVKVILSSATKNCDKALVRAFNMYLDGTLPFGEKELLGYKEGGVGIVKNDTYNNYFTDEQKAAIEQLEQDLIDGKFDIPQIRLETDNTKWEALKASVQ
ncbi:MAG: BMP family protein [Anaerorhabdus sp.]|uniref:BMP family lipoprotein n=1 Tax=Anaerorhabdus sp. TaxID=1872524 RepID=UPI003A8C77B4